MNKWLEGIGDARDKRRIVYRVAEIMWTGILLFVCKLGSKRQIRYNLNTAEVVKKMNILCEGEMERVCDPYTLDYFLEDAPNEDVDGIRWKMINRLIRNRVLEGHRLFNRYYRLILDGTGCLHFNKRHCERCLTQRKGKEILYYHPVLEAKIVCENGMVLSIGTEFIENEPGRSKQDCELKAAYRLLGKIKQTFPQLAICLLLDSLYACRRIFKICKENRWRYIVVFKEGSMSDVYKEYERLRRETPANTDSVYKGKNTHQDYWWVNGIDYYGYKLNILECYEKESEKAKGTRWMWITDFEVDRQNKRQLADKGGRLRWKIENEGFNMQKNGGYNLEHVYSENETAMKNYYIILQIAHIINQLMEKGSLIRNEMCEKFGSIRNIATRLVESLRSPVASFTGLHKELSGRFQIRLLDSFDSS